MAFKLPRLFSRGTTEPGTAGQPAAGAEPIGAQADAIILDGTPPVNGTVPQVFDASSGKTGTATDVTSKITPEHTGWERGGTKPGDLRDTKSQTVENEVGGGLASGSAAPEAIIPIDDWEAPVIFRDPSTGLPGTASDELQFTPIDHLPAQASAAEELSELVDGNPLDDDTELPGE